MEDKGKKPQKERQSVIDPWTVEELTHRVSSEEKKFLELKAEYESIMEWAVKEIPDDPELLVKRLGESDSYLARSGEMVATAKYLLTMATTKYILLREGEAKDRAALSKEMKQSVEIYTSREKFLYDAVERLNASITHIMDSLRTRVAYHKEYLSRTGGWGPEQTIPRKERMGSRGIGNG